ncbi:hypothetical protein BDK51DRAFT_42149 [Blyttiomyces helicus]|uniref:Uncharacterized protein n=1 Tax=Blyttiomyces helicus TaxID=388810 RepID=A0A4P9WC50_9FUNG|nr:hypothetical protein BDK51DRAFT_42149 [Blyttiomyces helicus]|eukprot:RKO87916.1 hypothetical protein BDK51DRAFT_42149 [Blyttiomyces helicus]
MLRLPISGQGDLGPGTEVSFQDGGDLGILFMMDFGLHFFVLVQDFVLVVQIDGRDLRTRARSVLRWFRERGSFPFAKDRLRGDGKVLPFVLKLDGGLWGALAPSRGPTPKDGMPSAYRTPYVMSQGQQQSNPVVAGNQNSHNTSFFRSIFPSNNPEGHHRFPTYPTKSLFLDTSLRKKSSPAPSIPGGTAVLRSSAQVMKLLGAIAPAPARAPDPVRAPAPAPNLMIAPTAPTVSEAKSYQDDLVEALYKYWGYDRNCDSTPSVHNWIKEFASQWFQTNFVHQVCPQLENATLITGNIEEHNFMFRDAVRKMELAETHAIGCLSLEEDGFANTIKHVMAHVTLQCVEPKIDCETRLAQSRREVLKIDNSSKKRPRASRPAKKNQWLPQQQVCSNPCGKGMQLVCHARPLHLQEQELPKGRRPDCRVFQAQATGQ